MKTKPMTMRVVSSRGILVVAALAVFLLHPPLPARGGLAQYHFHQIANTHGAGFALSPAINALGQVSFWTVNDTTLPGSDPLRQEVIWKGEVGSVEAIADTTTGSVTRFGPYPTINDLGDVGFSANLGPDRTSIFRYTAATQGITTIASADRNDSNSLFSYVDSAAINNGGMVAFKGVLASTDERFIALGSGAAPVYMIDVLPPQWEYRNPVISGDTVAWRAGIGEGPSTVSVIKKGTIVNQITIAAGSMVALTFLEVGNGVSISSTGNVAFNATTTGGSEGIYYGNGGQPIQVADTNSEFAWFYQVTAISEAGIAFNGVLDYAGRGVFTGPNVLTDKVLVDGDTVAGLPLGVATTVQTVSIFTNAMNDYGQIAMSVKFTDGTSRIIRADPFVLPQIHEWWLSVAVMKADQSSSMSQMVAMPGGVEFLSFDYAFPTTDGQLVVTLAGVELARIDAPDELADGFTTFQIPVDVNRMFPDQPDELLLEFSLLAARDTTGLFLDNIAFSTLDNGSFATGDLAGWRALSADGESVGVAVDPFYTPIPEPATLSLLGIGGLVMLRRRRK